MKVIFEDYADELSVEEYKELMAYLKKLDFAYLFFSLRKLYRVDLKHAP